MDKQGLIEHLEACKKLGKNSITVDVCALLKILTKLPTDAPKQKLKSSVNMGWDGGGFS
jgi:hypothetical protein